MKIKIPLIFLWVGFVSAISFMEAWLKFTAPGVTLTTGLAIGQVVFGALNRVELIVAIILCGLIVTEKPMVFSRQALFILAIVILQELISEAILALVEISIKRILLMLILIEHI